MIKLSIEIKPEHFVVPCVNVLIKIIKNSDAKWFQVDSMITCNKTKCRSQLQVTPPSFVE